MDPPFFHLLGSLADRPVGIFIAPYPQPTRNPLKISHWISGHLVKQRETHPKWCVPSILRLTVRWFLRPLYLFTRRWGGIILLLTKNGMLDWEFWLSNPQKSFLANPPIMPCSMVSLSEVVLVSLMVVYSTFSFAALCLVSQIPSISSWVQIHFSHRFSIAGATFVC